MRKSILILISLSLLAACSASPASTPTALPPTVTAAPVTPTAEAVATLLPTETPLPTATPRSTLAPDEWKTLPVLPTEISQTALDIYRRGLELGNNPNAFAKIGDCDATPGWFLGDFDGNQEPFNLGPYTDLQSVIDRFKGSFERVSVAAQRGFNTSSLLSPMWADQKVCEANETPLDCEFRIMKPSIVLILLGTNDSYNPDNFESQLRQIIEHSIERGVLPVLATKADNLEGNYFVNETIARLAVEYDIPLWNFWAAVQDLPSHGLQEDGAHLTWAPNLYDDASNLDGATAVRNLNALQLLDLIVRSADQ